MPSSENSLSSEERLTLEVLNAVQENRSITQRSLAGHLDVALGLANSYLKRCAKKGLIKIAQAPSNRYSYYLTPTGLAEKSRLTAEYLRQSFNFYRIAREQSGQIFQSCENNGWSRVALIGKSELTEIAILSASESTVEIAGIVDQEAFGTTSNFMNIPIVEKLSNLGAIRALILTDMKAPQASFEEVVKIFPKDNVLTLPILDVRREPLAGTGGKMKRWYVVRTKSREEHKARFNLERQGINTYLPLFMKKRRHARKTDYIRSPLFPSYLFVELNLDNERWSNINSTIGVQSLMTIDGRPCPVPIGIVEDIRQNEDGGGLMSLSLQAEIKSGHPIKVIAGAFSDRFGKFLGLNEDGRISVLMEMLGREVRLNLSPAEITI